MAARASESTRSPLSVHLVALLAAGHSGVPRYARELIRALDLVAPEAPEIAYTVLTTDSGGGLFDLRNIATFTPRMLRSRPARLAKRPLLEQVVTAASPADVLYYFDLVGPLLTPRRRFVATVHDATAGRRLTDKRWAYKRLLHPWAVRRAEALVAVSEFARREAIEVYGAHPERTVVVRSGPGLDVPRGTAPASKDSERRGFLYVGNFGRNKNVQLLIRAYEESDARGPLVLVGRSGDMRGEVEALASASKRTAGIEIRDRVSDEELERLYAASAAFVFPSRYEGFGFPPLEAMSRGCPVVASDIPALRETLGDAALFLPADATDAWARAFERVERDTSLREDLQARGTENVSRYSWLDTARGVTNVLSGLVRRPA